MKPYAGVILAFSLGLFSCATHKMPFWPVDKSPRAISRLVMQDLLSHPEFRMYKSGQVRAVHYSEVCTAFGAARIAALSNDSAAIVQLSERYMRVVTDSIENTANHVDANVYGILPLELYRYTHNPIFFTQGIDLANGQWETPQPNGLSSQTRFWVDDVWMIGSLQVQAYRITGDNIYLDRAATEIAAYLNKLQQPNGLFHHGENAPFYWGRGNGWVAAGLAELLSELPENHPLYPTIADGYKKMMTALLNFQSNDGMWRQLVDVESAWPETSCTAMFGYAITLGVKKGILPKKKFRAAYQKAWLALTGYISEDGKISQVCVGTGQSQDIAYYLERPTSIGDFHGQAPVLWFAWALLQE